VWWGVGLLRGPMPEPQGTVRDLYQEFGCTAVIRPFTYKDEITGETISVTISPQYSILTVGDREYYFKRESGAFDGTAIAARE
jgi:hypothetical protein